MDGQTLNDFQKVLGRTSGHHSRSKQFQVISSQHGLENGEGIVVGALFFPDSDSYRGSYFQ